MEEEMVQPGWRLPRSLMERINQAYYRRMAEGSRGLTKQEFVADLISGALPPAKSPQKRSSAARDGS